MVANLARVSLFVCSFLVSGCGLFPVAKQPDVATAQDESKSTSDDPRCAKFSNEQTRAIWNPEYGCVLQSRHYSAEAAKRLMMELAQAASLPQEVRVDDTTSELRNLIGHGEQFHAEISARSSTGLSLNSVTLTVPAESVSYWTQRCGGVKFYGTEMGATLELEHANVVGDSTRPVVHCSVEVGQSFLNLLQNREVLFVEFCGEKFELGRLELNALSNFFKSTVSQTASSSPTQNEKRYKLVVFDGDNDVAELVKNAPDTGEIQSWMRFGPYGVQQIDVCESEPVYALTPQSASSELSRIQICTSLGQRIAEQFGMTVIDGEAANRLWERKKAIISQSAPMNCCKVCRASIACGDTCISPEMNCNTEPGCACDG